LTSQTSHEEEYVLHGFSRSGTSFRTRIALNLKGVSYRQVSYSLREQEQRSPEYLDLNSQGLVPTLVTPKGEALTQSLAIIEWLDLTHPYPRLIPEDPLAATRVRALAYRVACDVHPIDNLRVLIYLEERLGCSKETVADWYNHWIVTEFESLEADLKNRPSGGPYCFGENPTLADVCLIPQVVNATRFGLSLEKYPTLSAIADFALNEPAFGDAHPDNQ